MLKPKKTAHHHPSTRGDLLFLAIRRHQAASADCHVQRYHVARLHAVDALETIREVPVAVNGFNEALVDECVHVMCVFMYL